MEINRLLILLSSKKNSVANDLEVRLHLRGNASCVSNRCIFYLIVRVPFITKPCGERLRALFLT